MECINCTQCIDACDSVMEKIGKPRGLIRYSSQAAMEPAAVKKGVRFRVIFYPVILGILAVAWLLVFSGKGTADVALLRNNGAPYSVLGSGASAKVANPLKLKITNRNGEPATYRFELIDFPGAQIDCDEDPITVAAGASRTVSFLIEAPASAFPMGKREAWMRVSDGKGFDTKLFVKLLGPMSAGDLPNTAPATGANK